MPPCGYRAPAIQGIEEFLKDNLNYFESLYRAKGMTVQQAISTELEEIGRIRRGARGGQWSVAVVELNAKFYHLLQRVLPCSWDEAIAEGCRLIDGAASDLQSLGHATNAVQKVVEKKVA